MTAPTNPPVAAQAPAVQTEIRKPTRVAEPVPAPRHNPPSPSLDDGPSKAPARVKDTRHALSYVRGQTKPYAVPRPPEPAVAKVDPLPWADFTPTPERQRKMLLQVPELRLSDIKPASSAAETTKKLFALVKEIDEKNKKSADGYIRELMKKRSDLAGLPFLLGKDCQLPDNQATRFGELTLLVRQVLSRSIPDEQAGAGSRASNGRTSSGRAAVPSATAFWSFWSTGHIHGPGISLGSGRSFDLHREDPAHVAALMQLLAAEHEGFHRGLVDYLRDLKTSAATAALAREALFAPDAETRLSAVHNLRQREPDDYTSILLDGLRYPWSPVAARAAQALVQLERKDLVPRLVELLGAPDACAPFETTLDGKKVMAVRELVRINHHRNCLLCHAPAELRRDLVVAGPVPIPGRELPPLYSPQYYGFGSRGEGVLVRADITYLRQDFSVMQPAADHEAFKWPEMQRFDFLVRTRELKPEQLAAHRDRERAKAGVPSEHHRIIVQALRGLTGRNLGTTSAEWRALLVAADNRNWRSPCLK